VIVVRGEPRGYKLKKKGGRMKDKGGEIIMKPERGNCERELGELM
jgi:hypothetical protein